MLVPKHSTTFGEFTNQFCIQVSTPTLALLPLWALPAVLTGISFCSFPCSWLNHAAGSFSDE